LKKKGIGVICLQPFIIMPKVGDKKFKYDEEGIAAAQAEASNTGQGMETDESNMIDEVLANLPEDGDPMESPEMETATPVEEAPTPLPDEGIVLQLFQVVYGTEYDPNSMEDQQKLQQIRSVLDSDPAMAQALASGDTSMTEFAIQLYRGQEAPPAMS
tara:strand:- start:65 stop:538 length:474 start_codon:yes stop_codon:yes gene_type:complete